MTVKPRLLGKVVAREGAGPALGGRCGSLIEARQRFQQEPPHAPHVSRLAEPRIERGNDDFSGLVELVFYHSTARPIETERDRPCQRVALRLTVGDPARNRARPIETDLPVQDSTPGASTI